MYFIPELWSIIKEYGGIYNMNIEYSYYKLDKFEELMKNVIYVKYSPQYENIVYLYEYGYIDHDYIEHLLKTDKNFSRKLLPIWYRPMFYSDSEYMNTLTKLFWNKVSNSGPNKKYYLIQFKESMNYV